MPKTTRKKQSDRAQHGRRSTTTTTTIRVLRSRSVKCLTPKESSSDDRGRSATSRKSGAQDDPSSSTVATITTASEEMTGRAATAHELLLRLKQLFIAAAATHSAECAVNAPAMSKYMRNKFKFYGFKAPLRRELQKEFGKSNTGFLKERGVLMDFLLLLWEEEEREMQGVACDIASQLRVVLLGETEEDFTGAMQCLKKMIVQKSWWDTVDALSYPVVGYMVQQRPECGNQLMEEWISEENLWLRRTAILHQLAHKEKTDQDRLFSFCIQRAHEKEFFIQKAIGWALRTYARTNKTAVKQFVETNRASLAPLSIREALKHIH